jgi:hypothetical protein
VRSLSNVGTAGDIFDRLQKHQANRLREQQAAREQQIQNMHAQQYAYNSLTAAAAMGNSRSAGARGFYGSMAHGLYGNPQIQQARAFFMAQDQQQQLGLTQRLEPTRGNIPGLNGFHPLGGSAVAVASGMVGRGAARMPPPAPGAAARSMHRSPEEAEQALRDMQRALLSGAGTNYP